MFQFSYFSFFVFISPCMFINPFPCFLCMFRVSILNSLIHLLLFLLFHNKKFCGCTFFLSMALAVPYKFEMKCSYILYFFLSKT